MNFINEMCLNFYLLVNSILDNPVAVLSIIAVAIIGLLIYDIKLQAEPKRSKKGY